MSLKLKLNLQFSGDLTFKGFLPETKADSLHFYLQERKYHVILYLSDREKQLSMLDDIPEDPKEIERIITLYCKGLTMEIEVADVDPEIIEALEASQPTEKTEYFGREIFNLVIEIHSMIVSYFRNIMKQYWIEFLTLNPDNYQSFLDEWNTVWLGSNSKWQRFFVVRKQVLSFTSYIHKNGVDRDTWGQISTFIEKGGRAPMRDVLIANSHQHLSQNNGRLAVVEAVTALESFIKQFLSKVILRLPGAPQIEEKQLDRLIQKTGLRLVTEVGLKMIMASADLRSEDIKIAAKAVEARNEILHGPRKGLEISLAQEYISAIERVIEKLESWTTKKKSGRPPESLESDPLEKFIGAFSSSGSDWADHHDKYLGENDDT